MFTLDIGLCGGNACNGYAEGAAGNIVEPNVMAELDGAWIAAMLAANTILDAFLFRVRCNFFLTRKTFAEH